MALPWRQRLWFGAGREREREREQEARVDRVLRRAAEHMDAGLARETRKAVLQIRLDVPRTWSSHPVLARSGGKAGLERMLVAWCLDTGRPYVQGMNFLGAMALVVAGGDVDLAFRGLERLLQGLEPVYGCLSHVKDRTKDVEAALREQDPDLAVWLLDRLEVNLLAVTPSHFLTCFFSSLRRPVHALAVVDGVFAQLELEDGGDPVGFLGRVSCHVLIAMRAELLACTDEGEVLMRLKFVDSGVEEALMRGRRSGGGGGVAELELEPKPETETEPERKRARKSEEGRGRGGGCVAAS